MISAIVAASSNNIIGNAGSIPWRLKTDMKSFRKLTMGHHLLMGRKTYQSIGQPLKGRKMMILSKNNSLQIPGCEVFSSIESAIESANNSDETELFIGGGAEIYQLALPLLNRIYFTRIHAVIEGDTTWPVINWNDWINTQSTAVLADSDNDYSFNIEIWDRK
jgi:dihydrofolate reductase